MPFFLALWPLLALTSESNIRVGLNQPGQINQAVQQLVRMIEETMPKVVLLSEDHRDFVTKSFYKSIIEEVARKSGKRICYFLETAEAYQPALERLDLSDPTSSDCFESSHRAIKRDFLEVFGFSPSHWLDTMRLAELKQQGVKIIAIDRTMTRDDFVKLKKIVEEKSSSDPQVAVRANEKFDDMIVRDRNEFMSAKIQDGFKKYNCDVGFLSVGRAHILPPPRVRGLGEVLPAQLSSLIVNGRTCKNDLDCPPDVRATINVTLVP